MATFSQSLAGSFTNQHNNFLQLKPLSKSMTFQPFPSNPSSSHLPLKKSRNSISWPHAAKRTMHSFPSPTALDLKLTVQRSSTLVPWTETERRTMFLSDLEQYLNFNLGTIAFFPANSAFPPETVVETLETAFRKALVYYDYLAGRLRFNTEQGRLEIDCNSAGAGFVVISSDLTLAELGNLVTASPAFQQLETMRPEICLFVLQVVLFKCGGFVITMYMNHVTLNGSSLKMFMDNLASLLASDQLLFMPQNDRQLLSAQPPSRLTFSHLKDINLELSPKTPESDINAFQVKSVKPETKVFRISPDDIMKLKLKAIGDGKRVNPGARFSTFKVVTAHIWRCKGLARNPENDPEKKSTIHFPVDIWPILQQPQLPWSYSGNAMIDAFWTVTCQELKERPFSELVDMISKALSRITEDHIRSVIDSGEWLTGFPYGDVIVTPWTHLGFNEVQYPWGMPTCTCPLVLSDWNDIIIMFPDYEEDCQGANIVVTLPSDEMEKFESLFHNFM